MVGRSLASVLDGALRACWPRRSQRELLLDLGEHKAWTDEDHAAATQGAAGWLAEALGLPAFVDVAADVVPHGVEAARALGARLAPDGRADGVPRWAVGLAPAVGTSGKTLANSCIRGLRSARPDHRWLRLIARVADGEEAVDAWSYHRRSRESVRSELARLTRPDLDAGDALLLVSLLALWQRRRPTAEARGNRGRTTPRRVAPKPVAALGGTLLSPGQVHHLEGLAGRLPTPACRALLTVTVEAALTEAHLAPHRPRRSNAVDGADGERWLGAVDALVARHRDVLGDDAEVFGFRVAAMRRYARGGTLPEVGAPAVHVPYVAASVALERVRAGGVPLPTFHPDQPGLLMLLPQLRARGLLVSA